MNLTHDGEASNREVEGDLWVIQKGKLLAASGTAQGEAGVALASQM